MMERIETFLDERFQWHHDPTVVHEGYDDLDEDCRAEQQGSYNISPDGQTLTLKASGRTDYWSKTYYEPTLVKSNASALLFPIASPVHGEEITFQVDFTFSPRTQFDQGGILLYVDDAHWMKCGIEYCDDSPRLSVVVCNDYSDWSTQLWHDHSVRLRVHTIRQSSSFVVEAAPCNSESFQMIRIGHLASVPSNQNQGQVLLPWRIGPYAACPGIQKGCVASFTRVSIGPRGKLVHDASLETSSNA